MLKRIAAYDPASKAAMLSVASNGLLLVLKLTFALLFGSVALLGDGIDSAEDLVASALVFFSVRLALQPPDEKHPYGHGKAESLAALSQAGLIAGGAIFIAFAATRRLLAEDPEIYVWPSLIAVGITAAVNLGVAGYAFRAARLTGSIAVASDARHLLTNVVQAGAVGAGLVLVGVTGNHVWDPVVALLLAAYLAWIAVGILRIALSELIDSALPVEDLATIEQTLAKARPGLRGYHALRTRRSGREAQIDAHLLVDPAMSVADAHRLSDHIEQELEGLIPGAIVTLHMDPDDPAFVERARPSHEVDGGLHLHKH